MLNSIFSEGSTDMILRLVSVGKKRGGQCISNGGRLEASSVCSPSIPSDREKEWPPSVALRGEQRLFNGSAGAGDKCLTEGCSLDRHALTIRSLDTLPISLSLRDPVTCCGFRVIHLNADRQHRCHFLLHMSIWCLELCLTPSLFPSTFFFFAFFLSQGEVKWSELLVTMAKSKSTQEHLLRDTTESFVSIIFFFETSFRWCFWCFLLSDVSPKWPLMFSK